MNQYEKLTHYIDAAATLAESMAEDLRNGTQYTNETVSALSVFISTSYAVKDMLDTIEDKNVKLN